MRNPATVTIATFAVALATAFASPARADVLMSGTFVASTSCPAVQSIRKATNPGEVAVSAGQSYRLVSANAAPVTHYLLIVPGASPERRWVEIGCGEVQSSSTASAPAARPTPSTVAAPSTATRGPTGAPSAASPTHFVLSISWEPGFCAGMRGKPECRGESPGDFDASHFTLHGLWPDPREYCGVAASDLAADKAGRWDALPAVDLSAATRAHLTQAMPGTQSLLERHEWLRHGTCSGVTADAYFGRALGFLDAINASSLRQLFTSHLGGTLSLDDIRAAVDQSFGADAGQRIRLSCSRGGGDRRITELTIGLDGDVLGSGSLATLIAAARPTNGGCDSGVVTALN